MWVGVGEMGLVSERGSVRAEARARKDQMDRKPLLSFTMD
jgi:hypothetical protein